jgi:hypothetical protein
MSRLLFFILIFSISYQSSAQNVKKRITTKFIEVAPNIDGVLDDIVWQSVGKATDFVMFKPGTGTPEPETNKTEVMVVYDNSAIYIAAYLFDEDPKNIPMQFSSRDNFGQSDFFGVSINPFNDGVNDSEFFVASTGTQADAKVTTNGEDFSWNAVWKSAVALNDKGWTVEMKIPYSALRFSNEAIQTWGINFHRLIQNTREQYSWNLIDKTKGRITEHSGELIGIKNINPPIRLSFYPYAQATYTHFDGTGDLKATAGLDIKYGINDSFTLDATLIPDFGQVAFDDVVLNLGPFEQQYDEKRAFFTEGTELFEKGGLFYTRRVGDTPLAYYDVYSELSDDETIIENPDKVRMINAVKVSGRTKSGFGLGVFNAITKTTEATIKNELTGEERTYITSPFTNYNVLVLDQQFNKNSSVSLVNTNVLRKGNTYDANVTSVLLDLRTKSNKYAVETDLSLSNKFYNEETITGFKGQLGLNKVSGAHQYGLSVEFSDKNYDRRDLGYQQYQNYIFFQTEYSYRIFEPKGNLNNFRLFSWQHLIYRQNPFSYIGNGIGVGLFATTNKFLSFGGKMNINFGYQNDYYEPREEGRFYRYKEPQSLRTWISTDYRKRLAFDLSLRVASVIGEKNQEAGIGFSINPRFRFNDKFQMVYSFDWEKKNNENGFVTTYDDKIIFGQRNSKTLINALSGTLNLSTKSAFSLSFRYYWSPVTYSEQLYTLQDNGSLQENTYEENFDRNFNSWNLDLSYSLEFAPGSQLVALYRNTIFDQNNQSRLSFEDNIDNLFKEPISHQVSLKLIYYLDYNSIKI